MDIVIAGIKEMIAAPQLPGTLQYIYGYVHLMNTGKPIPSDILEKGFQPGGIEKILQAQSFIEKQPFIELLAKAMAVSLLDIIYNIYYI